MSRLGIVASGVYEVSLTGAGSITAGTDTLSGAPYTGYSNAGFASIFGGNNFGSISNSALAPAGTVGAIVTQTSGGTNKLFGFTSSLLVPTSITVSGTQYALTFRTDAGGYHVYDIAGLPNFINGGSYTWSVP